MIFREPQEVRLEIAAIHGRLEALLARTQGEVEGAHLCAAARIRAELRDAQSRVAVADALGPPGPARLRHVAHQFFLLSMLRFKPCTERHDVRTGLRLQLSSTGWQTSACRTRGTEHLHASHPHAILHEFCTGHPEQQCFMCGYRLGSGLSAYRHS